jgi:hypothetical protein
LSSAANASDPIFPQSSDRGVLQCSAACRVCSPMIMVAVHIDVKVDACVYQTKLVASVYKNIATKHQACHREEVSRRFFR